MSRLLALGLELPEETFVELHPIEANGVTRFRACPIALVFAPVSRYPANAWSVQCSRSSKQATYLTALRQIRVLNVCASYPRTDEEEAKTKNVWMKGHTDTGTITLLWSQPVVALQIMSPDGKWRYVRHVPNGIVSKATHHGPLSLSSVDLNRALPADRQCGRCHGDVLRRLLQGDHPPRRPAAA